jgi:hypothetical protein
MKSLRSGSDRLRPTFMSKFSIFSDWMIPLSLIATRLSAEAGREIATPSTLRKERSGDAIHCQRLAWRIFADIQLLDASSALRSSPPPENEGWQ